MGKVRAAIRAVGWSSVLLTASINASADPVGYAVNSRGFAEDPAEIHVLWRVDLATGASQRVGPTRFLDMEGLAFSPDGTLYGADDESKTLVTINTSSGFSTPVGGVLNNMGVPLQNMDFGMTFTCDGQLWLSSDIQQSLFSASLTTGRLTRVGAEGSLGAPITGLAAWGDALYGLGQGVRGEDGMFSIDAPNLYRIDRDTGRAELIGSLGSSVLPYANAGLAFDETGRLWAITDRREDGNPEIRSEIHIIDLTSGEASKSADADRIGFESLAIAAPGGCDQQGRLPPTGAVEIPSHSPGSLAWLLSLLLLSGFWTLNARQR